MTTMKNTKRLIIHIKLSAGNADMRIISKPNAQQKNPSIKRDFHSRGCQRGRKRANREGSKIKRNGNKNKRGKITMVVRKAVRKEKVKTGKVRKAKIRGGIRQAIMEYRGNIIIISNNKIK